jgi:hypothetical protein
MNEQNPDGNQGQAGTEDTQLSETASEQDVREAYVHILESMGASSEVIDAARQAAAEAESSATNADHG